MEEILGAVAEAVGANGTPYVIHRGLISEVAEPGTRFVVVPHEYFVLAPEEPAELYARTIGFGVEHPGTRTFRTSVAVARRLGARFEISEEAVEELQVAGSEVEHFRFGYVRGWDRWHGSESSRTIDVLYLGTADERRLGILATISDDLDGLSCELLIPPHEPMTRERPDFLLADRKWEMLVRSKVLVNLHREDKLGFEWIRALEAAINGCVVVTEPSTDLGPLVPGEHLLVADRSRIGAVARAVVGDDSLRQSIARRAYDLCRTELQMEGPARRLVSAAMRLDASLPGSGPDPAPAPRAVADGEGPLAVWIPEVAQLPDPAELNEDLAAELAELALRRHKGATVLRTHGQASPRPAVDIICVRQPGDGPLGATLESLRDVRDRVAIHVAHSPVAGHAGPPAGVTTHLAADLPLGRGPARNLLLDASDGDLVCVLDSGDRVRPGALQRLSKLMADEPALDVAFAMATLGPDRMVNVLVPEPRRMASRIYLTRGFIVRRRLLERIGGFSEGPLVEGFVDHVFWRTALAAGASIHLARWVGFSLWPQAPGRLPAESDPYRARLQVLGNGSG